MNQSRKTKIQVRLTPEEKEKIDLLAKKCGMSVSRMIRQKILHPKSKFIDKELRKKVDELINEGRNLNRTLNLYHEERQKYTPFLAKLRKFVKKVNY